MQTDGQAGGSARSRLAARSASVLAFAWILAATYHPLLPAAGGELDGGWAQALGVALLRGFVFGRDVIFTYGPLGWFWTPLYQPELFRWHFVWQLGFGSLQALIVVRAVRAWASPMARGLAFACVVASIGLSHDATACVTIIAGMLALARRPAPGAVFAGSVVLACALLSLQKFTLALLACVAFASLGVALAARHRRLEAVAYPLGFVLACVSIWAVLGQPISALVDFASGSWQITSGFSHAMATEYDRFEQAVALVAFGLAVALVLAGLARERSVVQAALSLVVVAGCFVTWKAGFVRSAGHTQIAFAFALLSPLWIGSLPSLGCRLRAWGAALMVALGVLGLLPTDPSFVWARSAWRRPMGTWLELSAPLEARARLEQALAESRREHALPRIRERVSDASIDVLPWGVGVLVLHGLDWRPRPVFQSYAAYTPTLVERNADHFRSESRPRFVLVHEGTIDRRHPLHDDGESWIEILRRYSPVLYEDGFLLFEERSPEAPPARAEVLAERMLRPGETLELSALVRDACYVGLEIELEQTLLGRLRELLYRGARVHLDSRFGEGVVVRHRIVPGIAERGFLVVPAAYGVASWLFHLEGVALTKPTSISIDIRRSERSSFAPEALVRVVRLDEWVARDCTRPLALGGHPNLSRLPDALGPPSSFQHFAGTPKGLLAHAPSWLAFELGPGPHTLGLRYAVGEGAHVIGSTDGVVFEASVVESGGPDASAVRRVLLRRGLEPVSVEADRGVHDFETTFDLAAPGTLMLETGPGPAGDAAWDWSVWVDVSIDAPKRDRSTGAASAERAAAPSAP